jgi:hypothetical protein
MDQVFFPLAALERISRPLLRLFALVLLLVSLWGFVNLSNTRGQTIKVVIGVAGAVQEEHQEGVVRYSIPFTVEETGEAMTFWVRNNGPVLDYLVTRSPTTTIALRYRPDDMMVTAVNALLPGVEPIQNRAPDPNILLATSILGLLLTMALLLPDLLGRFALVKK